MNHEQADSARAESQEQGSNDGIRSWVDYKGHVPRTLSMSADEMVQGGGLADFLRGLGVALAETADPVTVCAVCETDWPCKEALRAERDAGEEGMRERGDRLRLAGLPVDQGPQSFHPDRQTPRGRAVLAVQQEILRQAYRDIAAHTSQIANLLIWHPVCNDRCHGHHHTETMLIFPPCCEHHGQARVAQALGQAYGAAFLGYEPLPEDEQESARRAYAERMFVATTYLGGEVRPGAPEVHEATLMIAVDFLATVPLGAHRAMAAQMQVTFEREDLAAARAEGQRASGGGATE